MKIAPAQELILAAGLDALIGDPAKLPHPVNYIAKLAHLLESHTRPIADSRREYLLMGTIVSSLTIASSALIAELISRMGPLARIALISYALAGKSLIQAGDSFTEAANLSLSAAQAECGRYVGRDTSALDESQLSTAMVETLAENTCDAYIAPLFWAGLGTALGHGPAFVWAYKAISTLDSLYGYHNERNEYFGKTAAKLDDMAAYIPARISAPLVWLASLLCGENTKASVKCSLQEARLHESPNAGWTEAAYAGALDLELGGPSSYEGQVKQKAYFNKGKRRAQSSDIKRAQKLCIASCLCGLALVGLGLSLKKN